MDSQKIERTPLADLAREAGLSPNELFAKISGDRAGGSGAGLGRLSLRSLCEREGLSLEKAMGFLAEQGFTVTPETSLKQLAGQKDLSPAEVRDSIVANCR